MKNVSRYSAAIKSATNLNTVRDCNTLDGLAARTLCEVAVKVSSRVLVRVDLLAGDGTELGADDLEEVLEHILRALRMPIRAVERVRLDAQPLLHLLTRLALEDIELVVAREMQMPDPMPPVMHVLVAEIGHEFVQRHLVHLETATERELDAPRDLVDAQPTLDVAAFVHLALDLFFPPFLLALFDRVWVAEGPAAVDVGLADGFARVAAAAFGFDTAVAGAAVVGAASGDGLFGVVLKVWEVVLACDAGTDFVR